MNEHPETTDQHGYPLIESKKEACPSCDGLGYWHFKWIGATCPACNGTGKLSDALARKLSGES